MKQVLLPIAHATEELEVISIADILRRANMDVCIASVEADEKMIHCAHQSFIEADELIDNVVDKHWDMIVLPGGSPGVKHLQDHVVLTELLKKHHQNSGWIGGIGAAPAVVLAHHGLLSGNKACCYPGYEDELQKDGELSHNPVEVVGFAKLITARGPAFAMQFALTIIGELLGKEKADQVALGLLSQEF